MAAELTTEELMKLCDHFENGYGSISEIARALKSRLTAAPKPEPAGVSGEVAEIEKWRTDWAAAACKKPGQVLDEALEHIDTLLAHIRAQATPAATLGALDRTQLAYRIATARWAILYGKKIPPMWFVVEAGGTDGSVEANHLLDSFKTAEALLSPSQAQTNPTRKEGE